jgi:MFS family permease
MNALLPLFFAMPIAIGGLGLDPPTIGLTMGIYGASCGLFQGLFFSRIVRRFGERRVFMFGVSTFIPMFAMFPVISMFARQYGLCTPVWILIAVFLSLLSVMDLAYGNTGSYLPLSTTKRN